MFMLYYFYIVVVFFLLCKKVGEFRANNVKYRFIF